MGQWKFGAAKRVVTPPMGVALAGYGMQPERVAGAVLDDLFSRAMVFDDGARRVALVSVELITLSAVLTNAIRARVTKETGIPAEAIFLSATHSHSAPTTRFMRNWGTVDCTYLKQVEAQTVDAVVEAARNLQPASLGSGQVEAKGIAINRVRKDGPVDHTLRVLGVRGKDEKLAAAALNFACHPVHMKTDSRFVSADYPGRLLRDLERAHPGCAPAFFQGALGDINPEQTFSGADAAFDHGSQLARAAGHVLEGMAFNGSGEISFVQTRCELPLDIDGAGREARAYLASGALRNGHAWVARHDFMRGWAHETLGLIAGGAPETLSLEIQVLRIGQTAILGLPGEIYTLIGDAVRAASPFPNTWVVGFANDNIGYVTDPRDYAEESYAAIMAPKIYGHLPFKPEAWRVLADAGVAALKKL